jgi:hypothetical protein
MPQIEARRWSQGRAQAASPQELHSLGGALDIVALPGATLGLPYFSNSVSRGVSGYGLLASVARSLVEWMSSCALEGESAFIA